MILLFLACSTGASWPRDAHITALLRGLDRDKDGVFSSTELEAVRWGSAAPIDTDNNGQISEAELSAVLVGLDATGFDNAPLPSRPLAITRAQDYTPPEVRHVRDLLRFLCAEVRAVNPNAALPDEAAIQTAARTGRLDSPESTAALALILPAMEAAGLAKPAL